MLCGCGDGSRWVRCSMISLRLGLSDKTKHESMSLSSACKSPKEFPQWPYPNLLGLKVVFLGLSDKSVCWLKGGSPGYLSVKTSHSCNWNSGSDRFLAKHRMNSKAHEKKGRHKRRSTTKFGVVSHRKPINRAPFPGKATQQGLHCEKTPNRRVFGAWAPGRRKHVRSL